MSLLLSMSLAIVDGAKELISNSKDILVESEESLKKELEKRNVDISQIIHIDTGKQVTNWSEIRGVVKEGNQIFAFGNSIGSELNANLNTF